MLPTPIASLMDASDPGAPVPLLRSYLGDRVGGQWPSPTMASLFVGVKGLSSADHQFLASLGPEASSTVYLVPVLFGERDLLGFAEVLATVLERFRPLGLFRDSEIRLAYESNVVEVSFSTANDLVLNALRAAVPQAALSLLTLPGTAPKQRNASRVTLPYEGGLILFNQRTLSDCTSNFTFRRNLVQFFGSTAGHCNQVGDRYVVGNAPIGEVTRNTYRTERPVFADASLIELTSVPPPPHPEVFIFPGKERRITSILPDVFIQLGQQLCISVRSFNGGRCGTTVSFTFQADVEGVPHRNIYCIAGPPDFPRIVDQDSGGAVYFIPFLRDGPNTPDDRREAFAAGIAIASFFRPITFAGIVFRERVCFQTASAMQRSLLAELWTEPF